MEKHNNISGLITSDYACTENYTIFSVSTLQYVILALAYAKGKPFRQLFFKNYLFVAALVACTAFSIYAMIDPAEFIVEWLELTDMPPMNFRLIVLGLSIGQVTLMQVGNHGSEICIFSFVYSVGNLLSPS